MKGNIESMENENKIKVIIVEDNDNIRLGLQLLIDGTEEYSCKGVYTDCESMLEEVEDIIPDVVLMDIDLPGMSGIEGIRKLRKIYPDLRILVLTVYDESGILLIPTQK